MMTRICLVLTPILCFAGAAAAQPKWVRERIAFEKGCEEGDLAACTAAGDRLASGYNGPSGVPEERPAAAVPLYERACDGGHMPGCTRLASLYLEGKGVAKNVSRAAALFSKACDGSDASGCLGSADLAQSSSASDAPAKDATRAVSLRARAIQLITAACDGGDGAECTRSRRFLL